MIARRGFLRGILAAGMAPAIVKAEIIMPVRQIITIDRERFQAFRLHQMLQDARLSANPPILVGFDLGGRDMTAQVWMRRDGPFYRVERCDVVG